MRTLIASSASFLFGVGLAVGDFHLQPLGFTLVVIALVGYAYTVLTAGPVFRCLLQSRREKPVLALVLVCTIGAMIGAAVAGAAYWFLFAKPDLVPGLTATLGSADYPPGTALSGIPWSNNFSEVRLVIDNSSKRDWTNVILTARPDQPIAEVAQSTTLPGVTFVRGTDMTIRQEVVNNQTKQRLANPLVLIATSAGITIKCTSLPAQRRLEILMAAVHVNDTPKPGAPLGAQLPNGGIFEDDYVLKFTTADGTAHWYGHGKRGNSRIESVFGNRPTVKILHVEGTYMVSGDTFTTKQDIPVHDPFDVFVKKQ